MLTTAPDVAPSTARETARAGATGEHRQPCWFCASEVDALVLGVEAERTVSSDLKAFALGKLRDRSFRVTAEHALGGAQPPSEAGEHDGAYARRSMTVGQVLEALELEIMGIELGPVDQGATDTAAPARAA